MNPIERITLFPLNVDHDETTRVEITGSGGLSEVRHSDFETRAEALAYAERLGTHYGIEVEELAPDQDEPAADFIFRNHGSVWTVNADSAAAREFAQASLAVEPWQGSPTAFTTDHRAAAALADQLGAEGWSIEYL